jgi:hypothetical protein
VVLFNLVKCPSEKRTRILPYIEGMVSFWNKFYGRFNLSKGERNVVQTVNFDKNFKDSPNIFVAISSIDILNETDQRCSPSFICISISICHSPISRNNLIYFRLSAIPTNIKNNSFDIKANYNLFAIEISHENSSSCPLGPTRKFGVQMWLGSQ